MFFGKHILETKKSAGMDGIKSLGSYAGVILSLNKHLGSGEEKLFKSEGALAPTTVFAVYCG